MNLDDLISGLDVRPTGPVGRVRICDVTDDSRTVVPGSLFIARPGSKSDGRAFVGEAIAAGAVAVLTDRAGAEGRAVFLEAPDVPLCAARIAERFYGEPSSALTLIGVTGTNGKTTTAHLVHQVLNDAGMRCGLIGTVLVDDGREVAPATLTTPPAAELSRTMATMVESGCTAAVMEVSSHALDQRRVAALRFDIGIFTNLTGDHLDYHGTMEKYGAAKSVLFGMLPATGTAVLNAEDPWADRVLGASRARVLRCSVVDGGGPAPGPGACTATIRSMTMQGSGLCFQGPWGSFDADVPLVGRHNAMNALQAVAACHAAGVPMEGLRRAIIAAHAPPGRLEPVTASGPLADPFTVLVDYAHTDDALRKVLTALRPLVPTGGRLAVVFGCGGDRDRTKRPRMGAAAAELADVVCITSDNPRTEEPRAIIEEILAGIPASRRAAMAVDPDRKAAIRRAVESLAPGDVLLIAGKGHEPYQILPDGRGGTTTIHFDDREVARAALADRRRLARPRPSQSATS